MNIEFQQVIANKPKLESSIETEKYVSGNLSKHESSLIAKLRSGTLQLAIETGRFRNKEIVERLCIMSDQNLIEDEKYFLCVCPFYNHFGLVCTCYENK